MNANIKKLKKLKNFRETIRELHYYYYTNNTIIYLTLFNKLTLVLIISNLKS